MQPPESTSTIGAAEETATPMGNPKTADERERRFVQYLRSLNKSELADLRLARLNQVANFRKVLMQLLNEMVESRAQDLAAAMLIADAPEKPKVLHVVKRRRLAPSKAIQPEWIKQESKVLGGKR
jgi:hypothetical protein